MTAINIFLASSNELKTNQQQVQIFIRQKNNKPYSNSKNWKARIDTLRKLLLVLSTKYFIAFFIFLLSCNTQQADNQKDNIQIPNEVDSDYVFAEYIRSWEILAKQDKLICQNYYLELLNSPTNANLYKTSFSQALNLGVYSVDFAYHNSHYGEYGGATTALSLLCGIKKLSADIGVHQYIVVNKPRDSLSNKDTILSYHKEILLSIKNAVTEEKREYQAVLILLGAWTETMYLAVGIQQKLAANSKNKEAIIFRNYILSQGEQLNNIVLLLQLFDNKEKIKLLLKHLIALQLIYNQVDSEEKYLQIEKCIIDVRTAIISSNWS
jgi:hypothetical protein